MKKRVTGKRKFWLSILLLCIIGLSIGYSYLSQQLTINNTVNYGSMKWNVGFTAAEDYSDELYELDGDMIDYIGASMITVNPSISQDRKTVSFAMNFGDSTRTKIAAASVTLTNDSSFDVSLTNFELAFENQEQEELLFNYFSIGMICWFDSVFASDCEELEAGDVVAAGDTKNIFLMFQLRELSNEDLFMTGEDYKVNLNFEWSEAEER